MNKVTRLAMTITFTPDLGDAEIIEHKDPDSMLMFLYEKAQDSFEEFSEGMAVWQQMAGSVGDELTEPGKDLIEECDRAIIFAMDKDKAAMILNHPNTLKAMLLTFGQIVKDEMPQEMLNSSDATEEKIQ